MENLTKYLTFELSKYNDLLSIMSKLKDQGYLNDLYTLIKKIFDNEAEYTLQELIKLSNQIQNAEKFNIQTQFEINKGIFKSNFMLIMQLIIENVADNKPNHQILLNPKTSVSNMNTSRQEREYDIIDTNINTNNGHIDDNTRDSNMNNNTIDKKSINKMHMPKSKSLMNQEIQMLQAKTKMQSKTRTNTIEKYAKAEKTDRSNQISSTSILSTKNIESPLNLVLANNNSSFLTKNSQKNVQNGNGKTPTNQILNSQSLRNISAIGLNSSINTSKNIGHDTTITSEFSYVTGAATFGNSKRKLLEIHDTSPGPAQYNPENSSPARLKRSQSPVIGKAPKRTWIDQVIKTESPGPGGLYPSIHFMSK